MMEDDFKSMVIMECCGDSMKYSLENRNLYVDSDFRKDNIIYKNLNIDISDKRELINITISWEEVEEKKELIFNIDTLEREEHIIKPKLCKINIWQFHPQSRFVFMFFHSTNLIKSSEIIKIFLGNSNLRRISLSNTFFNNLVNYNNNLSLTEKTITIGFNYRNSLNNLLSSKNEERITEVKLAVNLTRNINVKINNKGMVKILNKPKFEEAYEIVEIINHTLIKVDSLGDLYCE